MVTTPDTNDARADKRAVAKVGAGVAAAGAGVSKIGDILKEQRLASRLSLRQLSELAGVSNPYLSQIERGLRKPSAEVLNSLAKALRISAEQLYVQAGLISPDSPVVTGAGGFEAAVISDTRLTSKQRQTLLDVHASFLAVNAAEQAAKEAEQSAPESGSKSGSGAGADSRSTTQGD